MQLDDDEFLGGQQTVNFIALPDVELAFLVFGIGIQRAVKAATRCCHFTQQPRDEFVSDLRVGLCRASRIQRQQLRVVVQHFLEVGNLPAFVDAVAAEAAAQLVVDAAIGHASQCQLHHFRRIHIQQQFHFRTMWKFWRTSVAAMERIEAALALRQRCSNRRIGHRFDRGRTAAVGGKKLRECRVLRTYFAAALIPECAHLLQHMHERWHAVTRLFRKIRAGVERQMVIGCQEHGQRPAAAALGKGLMRELVDLVQVRPFLTIHFYIDIQIIHHRCGGVILETLVRHHMAPVAGRIADREQDGLVVLTRGGERRFAPGPPVDGIFRMLTQVRAGFGGEAIGHGQYPRISKWIGTSVSLVAARRVGYRGRYAQVRDRHDCRNRLSRAVSQARRGSAFARGAPVGVLE